MKPIINCIANNGIVGQKSAAIDFHLTDSSKHTATGTAALSMYTLFISAQTV